MTQKVVGATAGREGSSLSLGKVGVTVSVSPGRQVGGETGPGGPFREVSQFGEDMSDGLQFVGPVGTIDSGSPDYGVDRLQHGHREGLGGRHPPVGVHIETQMCLCGIEVRCETAGGEIPAREVPESGVRPVGHAAVSG